MHAFKLGVVTNADGVFWRSLDENEAFTRLERLPLAGGDVETVAILPRNAGFSLLDDERLYFLSTIPSSEAVLNAVDLDTGETQSLMANPESSAVASSRRTRSRCSGRPTASSVSPRAAASR